jgi:hypothetical protein
MRKMAFSIRDMGALPMFVRTGPITVLDEALEKTALKPRIRQASGIFNF